MITEIAEIHKKNILNIILMNYQVYDINELENYIKQNSIKLISLNDNKFDLLLSILKVFYNNRINDNVYTCKVINFILKQCHYKTLNYSVLDENNESHNPLFYAIGCGYYKIASLLISHGADINYKVNQTKNIIEYIYSVYNSFTYNFEKYKVLKFILSYGFNIERQFETILDEFSTVKNLRDIQFLFKNYFYNKNFIINLLFLYKHKKAWSDNRLQNFINNEKNKLKFPESLYSNCKNNIFILTSLLEYDKNDKEILMERIIKYQLIEKIFTKEINTLQLLKKILSIEGLDLNQLNMEKVLHDALLHCYNYELFDYLIETLKRHSYPFNTINFETILLDVSKTTDYVMYFNNQLFLKKILSIIFEELESLKEEDFTKKYSQEYLNLIINIIIKLDNLEYLKKIMENEKLNALIDINEPDKNKNYPLDVAYRAYESKTDILDHPFFINNRKDETEIFEYLLEHGAESSNVNLNSLMLLGSYIRRHYKISSLLLKNKYIYGFNPHYESHHYMARIIFYNKIDILKSICDKEVNEYILLLDLVPFYFTHIMDYACMLGRDEILKYLVGRYGVKRHTLCIAILMENMEIIRFLIENDKHGKNTNYSKYLNIAINIGNKEIFYYLLDCFSDRFFIPPLSLQKENSIPVVKSLIENGMPLELKNEDGGMLFLTAIYNHQTPMIKFLLESQKNPEFVRYIGNWAMYEAVYRGYNDIAKLIIENGFKVNKKRSRELMEALGCQSDDFINYLIERGATIHYKSKEDQYRLIKALDRKGIIGLQEAITKQRINLFDQAMIKNIIKNGRLDLLKILIKNHMDINMIDKEGNTPLLYAIQYCKKEIADYLIQKGANINLINAQKETIDDINRRYNFDYNRNNYKQFKRIKLNH
ncbi:hypothetical protein H8356DRAFT_1304460 [Neocallimastix lanati (nom. inval.)]|nr:hypothetical protein H8356DRAFT_1304460 [Neocallimastix sp. JGI-2020a]